MVGASVTGVENLAKRKVRARAVLAILAETYPGTAQELCALSYGDAFELLVATILSAQCTDERVNSVTPELFAAFPGPEALAHADLEAVERIIHPTGFYHAKAQNLVAMATALVERFGGQVPQDTEDLVTLPGVGRKTANVVRSVAFGLEGIPVDTHVGRLSRRLGFTEHDDPVHVEKDLDLLVPPATGGVLSLRLILHGRRVCTARRPHCEECALAELCPSAPR
ncbi:MAG: endonuclease III [Actinomycetota bacterium]|nr:endonuclease III [Actinomycetota bacterium]